MYKNYIQYVIIVNMITNDFIIVDQTIFYKSRTLEYLVYKIMCSICGKSKSIFL